MAEKQRTSPLENIPPVAKVAESVEYITDKLLAHANKNAAAWPRAMQMLRNGSKLRSAQTRVWWRERMMVLAAKGQKGNNQLKRLAPFKTLTKSPVGHLTFKGLSLIGGAATFSEQIDKSTATTFLGKVVDGGLAGTAEVGLGYTLAAPIDTALYVGLTAAGIDPKGLTIGDNFSTGIRAGVTLGEALITGENEGLATYQERAVKGEYGPIFQAVAGVDSYWSQYGLVGGLTNVKYLFGN